MKIEVKRVARKQRYTIGRMFVDGKRFCDTLEDTDRGLKQDMPLTEIVKKKVYGETAIPMGKYKVCVTYWSKYKIYVPMLKDVPGYTGILIHNGTDQNSTLGCILVGENKIVGKLVNGRTYMHKLTDMVNEAIKRGESVEIVIS